MIAWLLYTKLCVCVYKVTSHERHRKLPRSFAYTNLDAGYSCGLLDFFPVCHLENLKVDLVGLARESSRRESTRERKKREIYFEHRFSLLFAFVLFMQDHATCRLHSFSIHWLPRLHAIRGSPWFLSEILRPAQFQLALFISSVLFSARRRIWQPSEHNLALLRLLLLLSLLLLITPQPLIMLIWGTIASRSTMKSSAIFLIDSW